MIAQAKRIAAPPKYMDLTGQRFGKLVAISRIAGDKNARWLCVCDCGNTKSVRVDCLSSGIQTGCGCRARQPSHGKSDTKIYRLWMSMRRRCEDPNNPAYKNYGGLNITVCERWGKFENFYAAMGERPEGMSLDRIDNSKGYSPENCRWATDKTQMRNTRANRIIEIDGIAKCLAEWCEFYGQPYQRIQRRIDVMGLDPKSALTGDLYMRNDFGENLIIADEAEKLSGTPRSTLYKLAKRGKIACKKFGASVRFFRDEMVAFKNGKL